MKCSIEFCNKETKKDHTMCRRHFIGDKKWAEEKSRNRMSRIRRSLKIERRRQFNCEMGYIDCEKRGYCNGDC